VRRHDGPAQASALYHRNDGTRHLPAACNLGEDRLYGHVKTRKRYIIWRNQHAAGECLHRIVERASAA
jgi:hypothetical protein